jgi:monolysocardiolipin acyltransferase
MSTLSMASKAFLNLGCRSLKVEGLEILLSALREPEGQDPSARIWNTGIDTLEKEGALSETLNGRTDLEEALGRRGIVTICNHTSVVDDPMVSRSRAGLLTDLPLILAFATRCGVSCR